jgi:hypothetical protein
MTQKPDYLDRAQAKVTRLIQGRRHERKAPSTGFGL